MNLGWGSALSTKRDVRTKNNERKQRSERRGGTIDERSILKHVGQNPGEGGSTETLADPTRRTLPYRGAPPSGKIGGEGKAVDYR